jgi:hypothetical protein
MLVVEKLQIVKILNQRITKKTRRKVYYEYLVKWENHPTEDVSWITETDIQKHGKIVDAGASPSSLMRQGGR